MPAGAPLVFWSAWVAFIISIGVIAAMVALYGGQQLLWGYGTGAGSISLANTAAGYFCGKISTAPPLGQVILAAGFCITMFVASFLRVLLLFLASVIILVVCVAGVGSALA